jgi:DNA-binding beta-propeller fold protein YncE
MFCGNPHDNKIYGANGNQSNVVITDATTHAILDTVTGIWQPTALVYNEHNNTVYVNSRTGTPSSIKMIDGTTNQLGDSISVAGPTTALCYNRYTNKLFTEDGGHCWLSVIDCGTNTLLKTIGVDTAPYYCMVWNPPNNRVYVGCWTIVPWVSSGISVIRDSGGGVEESPKPQAASFKPMATIARGELVLAKGAGTNSSTSWLLDISGRKVLDLQPGTNDVSRLAPGVYFVRSASGVRCDASSVERVSRVVIAR